MAIHKNEMRGSDIHKNEMRDRDIHKNDTRGSDEHNNGMCVWSPRKDINEIEIGERTEVKG